VPTDIPFSIPRSRPLYGPPPYAYRGCPQLIVVFRSSTEALRELVPTPMTPNPDDLAFLMIGTMVTDEFGTYREAIVAVPSTVNGVTGNHVVFHYVEDDKPMAAGRELMGWPKKLGDIRWTATERHVAATCERAGVTLIRASASLLGPASQEQLQLNPTWLNLKVIPSVVEGAPPDVAQITAMTLRDIGIEDAHAGPAELDFSSTADDPLEMLDVHEVIGGVFCRLSFDLPGGTVAHDYLTAAETRAEQIAGAI
jgi:acetoacetate decarboxylase